MSRLLSLSLCLPLTGCLGLVCGNADELEAGDVEGLIDEVRWNSEGAQWMHPGSSLQITTDSGDGWRLTVVARTTDEGKDVVDGVEQGSFPMRITLKSALEGGWALLYPSTGGSYSTEETEGGKLLLDTLEDDTMVACFEFEASDGTETIALENGLIRAIAQNND